MQKLGLSLSEEVENIRLKPLQSSELHADFIPVKFPIQTLNSTEIDSCVNYSITTVTRIQDQYHNAMLIWKSLIKKAPDKDYIDGEIVKLQIVELNVIGVSGELFSQIGKEIKNSYRPNPVMVLGYTNGDAGYLPTRQAFSEGGYEVDMAYRYYGRKGPFTEELEDIILKAAED